MQLPDDKMLASVSVKWMDVKGNEAPVQSVRWGTDRPDLLVITENGNGSVSISPLGPLGTAQVSATADADLGDGVVEVVALGSIEVIAGQAVAGTLDFGAPSDAAATGGGDGGQPTGPV